ncbi:MAG: hypothetical protein IJY08_05020 [Clostridia bacterium]|nr:hypothetical protein [Clostridia bacterium]
MKKTCLLFIILVLMLAGASCGGGDGELTDSADMSVSFTDENGDFYYTIIRPEGAEQGIIESAVSLADILKSKYEIPVSRMLLKNDSSASADDPAKEILIGNTNRPESGQALAGLSEGEWCIRVIGNKIILLGYDDIGTRIAVNKFIMDHINGDKTLAADACVTGTYTSDETVSLPAIVNTKYPTDYHIVADVIADAKNYDVDPTGASDSTRAIQSALDKCAAMGGGCVYLPEGKYRISGQIVIPPYVTLCGDWQDPEQGNEYGTVLMLYVDSVDDDTKGTVMLGGSGGVVGLTVYYPEQTVDNVKPYPFTFYTDGKGSSYMLSTVKNVTVINGYRGIGACCVGGNAHEQLTVENFYGTFLHSGTEVYNQADVGTWQNVNISPDYWLNVGMGETAPDEKALKSYVKSNTTGLILGDLEWTEFIDLTVEGCKYGIHIVDGKRIQFAGSLYDCSVTGCTVGLLVDDLDTRWGMVVARSRFEGDRKGIINNTSGNIKCCDVDVIGGTQGQKITLDNTALDAYEINTSATYPKPVTMLYVAELSAGNVCQAQKLQEVLDKAGRTGGIVYVPAGVYFFKESITVPAGVELRGAGGLVATRDQASGKSGGTVFLSEYGLNTSSPALDTALITLEGKASGLNSVRIIYRTNSPYASGNGYKVKNTTYAVRGKAENVYCINTAIVGAAYGIDFRNCDGHYIGRLMSCCYYNAIAAGGKDGVITGCLQNATVMTRTTLSGLENWATEEGVFDTVFPITKSSCIYIILDDADGQRIYNTFAYGVCTLVRTTDTKNILCVNLGSDNIGGYQIDVRSGVFMGINLMRWNGYSYRIGSVDGKAVLINRLTINLPNEPNVF